jgi:hypothetical protein
MSATPPIRQFETTISTKVVFIEMKIYKCEKCGEGFSNFQQKANHTRWHHKELVYLENKKKTLNRLIQEIQTGMDKIVKFY